MALDKMLFFVGPKVLTLILMPCPLLIFSQSDYLIQVVDTNSNTEWKTVQIQISWLLQKPTDPDLHCLQRQGISGFSRTRVNILSCFSIKTCCWYLSQFTKTLLMITHTIHVCFHEEIRTFFLSECSLTVAILHLTLVLLNLGIPCLRKQCRSRSVCF